MGILRKKIVIAGRTASGKTTLKNELCREWNLKPEISFTSRNIREGEVDGIDYHFVSKSQFEQMIAQGKMLEHDLFNGNYYGTSIEEFDKSDVMIMTPEGINHSKAHKSSMFVVYLYAPQAIIMDRLTSRHRRGNPTQKIIDKQSMEIIRERMRADNHQFAEFEALKAWDIQIDTSHSLHLMLAQIKKYSQSYS